MRPRHVCLYSRFAFEEVNGIRKQGHRPNLKRHRELDPEIAQVQQRHEPHGLAQCRSIVACVMYLDEGPGYGTYVLSSASSSRELRIHCTP